MKFVPNYCVSYRGEFHRAGSSFEINQEDVQEMSKHGTVFSDAKPEAAAKPEVEIKADEPQKRPGRPKKEE